jgi:iduronate 2-sulfatase
MHTPNLDSLASKSLLLKRAFVQQALCSPSRTSLLTGRRPDTTHVYDLSTYFRKAAGNFTTIPQFFKNNGYLSIGMGKIFHPGMAASGDDDPISWTEPYYQPKNPYNPPGDKSWHAASADELKIHGALEDQLIAQHALEVLERTAPKAKTGEQPVFIAVGFHRPHLPFVFPEEFLQFYPNDSIRVPDNQFAPVNMPKVQKYFEITISIFFFKFVLYFIRDYMIVNTVPFYLSLL